MARRNKSARRPQSRRRSPNQVKKPTHHLSPVSVERMVVPTGTCGPRKKARFATEAAAAEALKQAQVSRRANHSLHIEKRYYKCDRPGCGGYHLTSREEYNRERTN